MRSIARFGALVSLVGLVGCGAPVVENLGSSPTPSGSPEQFSLPLQGDFDSNVQPFIDASSAGESCSDALCHDTDAPQLGLIIYVAPDASQAQANYERLTCYPFTSFYNPPSSTLLDKFCNDDVSNNAPHNNNTATDAQCAAIFNWIQTGTGNANQAPSCP